MSVSDAMHYVLSLLRKRTVLWILFIVNFLGSIYGFYWYKEQLALTEPKVLTLFVPDSPTASAFFTFVLLLYLCSRRSPLLEAFASITLFKYGIWAVVMIFWGAYLDVRPMTDVGVFPFGDGRTSYSVCPFLHLWPAGDSHRRRVDAAQRRIGLWVGYSSLAGSVIGAA
jgi:hypothetical protein